MSIDDAKTGSVPYEPHIGESRQYWRDIILGVNDGLVSMFLLIAGVVGGGLATGEVLLTAIAGAIAGAISMAAGEYLATKSQDEVLEAELTLEKIHLRHHREMELEQLGGFFRDMGIADDDVPTLVAAFNKSDQALLNAMKALEFGVVDSERRSPFRAMFASGVLFLFGSLPSVIPFVVVDSPMTGLIWATVFALGGLFAVGIVKARVARIGWLKSGLENVAIAGLGGVGAWAIGSAIGTTLV